MAEIPEKRTVFDYTLPEGAHSVNVPMPLSFEYPLASWDIDKCTIDGCDYMWHAANGRHFSMIPTVLVHGAGCHKLDVQDHGYEIEMFFIEVKRGG